MAIPLLSPADDEPPHDKSHHRGKTQALHHDLPAGCLHPGSLRFLIFDWKSAARARPETLDANGKQETGLCKILYSDATKEPDAKSVERTSHPARVGRRGSEPNIKVFGIARLGLADYRVGSDHEILNLTRVERL